jgi:hypothetical protein
MTCHDKCPALGMQALCLLAVSLILPEITSWLNDPLPVATMPHTHAGKTSWSHYYARVALEPLIVAPPGCSNCCSIRWAPGALPHNLLVALQMGPALYRTFHWHASADSISSPCEYLSEEAAGTLWSGVTGVATANIAGQYCMTSQTDGVQDAG